MFDKIIAEYTRFDGRLNRKPYFQVNVILSLVNMLISGIFYLIFSETIFSFISFVLMVITTVVSLSITFRRLHDLGHSKVAYLWLLVPVINLYWFYKIFCVRGTYGENEYGPDPLLTLQNNL